MFVDARRLEPNKRIEADVCVIGAGAAGITIARELVDSEARVCVLESGSLEEEPRTQALARGEVVGLPYFELDRTRSRRFGGCTNRWGGWCRPLDELDFEERSWVPYSGWPIRRRDLEPFYRRAESICELDRRRWPPAEWGDAVPALYRPPFTGGPVRAMIYKGSPPTKFGQVYRPELDQASNVTVYLNANAVELEASEGARVVTGVRAACLDGPEFRVAATLYVLAAGAIETARLLLASNRVQSVGLGNGSGNVGRFFMEHPHVVSGRIVLTSSRGRRRRPIAALDRGPAGFRERLALQRPVGGFKCAYGITGSAQAEQKLLNFSTHLMLGSLLRREELQSYQSLKLLASNMRSLPRTLGQLRRRALPAETGSHVKNVLLHLDEVAGVIGDEFLRRPTELGLFTQSEQAPDPRSRVSLGDVRDELGVPRARLEWRLGRLDKDSIRRAQRLIGERLEETGVGHLKPEEWLMSDDDAWGPALQGGHHHMGTARMSRDPAWGVVDANCRAHEVENLFIADSSVFATGGYANPLLTIVALSLRLAEHLERRLETLPIEIRSKAVREI